LELRGEFEPVTSVYISPKVVSEAEVFYETVADISLGDIVSAEFVGFSTSATPPYIEVAPMSFEELCSKLSFNYDRGMLEPVVYGFSLTAQVTERGSATPLKTVIGRKGEFSSLSKHNIPRRHHTATTLEGGDILLCGGVSPKGNPLKSCDLFSPEDFKYTAKGPMFYRRYLASSVLLPNGKVLITGGIGKGGQILSSAEVYNPESGTFRFIGDMLHPRYWHYTFVVGEVVFIVGGVTSGGVALKEVEKFDPKTEKFEEVKSFDIGRFKGCYGMIGSNIFALGGFTDKVSVLYSSGTIETVQDVVQKFLGYCSVDLAQETFLGIIYDSRFSSFDGSSFRADIEIPANLKGAKIISLPESDAFLITGGFINTDKGYSPSATSYVISTMGDILLETKMKKERVGHTMSTVLEKLIFVLGGEWTCPEEGECYGVAEVFMP
jgi:hypothetical protein